MALKVRRVITGHDANGKAVVTIDEVVSKLKEGRPGAMVAPIWTTEGFPVNNDGQDDAATRQVGTTLPNGTILRVVEFSPGVQLRNHRTDSIFHAVTSFSRETRRPQPLFKQNNNYLFSA